MDVHSQAIENIVTVLSQAKTRDDLLERVRMYYSPDNVSRRLVQAIEYTTSERIDSKPDRNKRLIIIRYGIVTGQSLTITQTARRFDLSSNRVGQICRRFQFYVLTLAEFGTPPRISTDETPIAELGLPIRIYLAFLRRGVFTLQALANHTLGDLYDIPNLGESSVKEIQTRAAQYGLKLE